MLKEFKAFAMRGNVIDMAVGVIVGGAFGKIVTSLVNDVLMPPLGLVVSNVDFSDLHFVLRSGSGETKPVTLNYGLFMNNLLNFLIQAFCIFLVVRLLSRLHHREQAPAAPTEKKCPYCRLLIPIEASRCGHCTSPL